MDNYTKMCDCPEIQDGWEPKVGDWTDKGVITLAVNHLIQTCSDGEYGYFQDKSYLIYRPSIEQLMGMVEVIKDKHHRLFRFFAFLHESYYPTTAHNPYIYFMNLFDSDEIEQELWLAFVMHELHNLTWRNGKWIK